LCLLRIVSALGYVCGSEVVAQSVGRRHYQLDHGNSIML
jgi:hypothetical protein